MAVMVDNDDDNDDGNDEDNNICFVLLVASKHRQFRWPRQASRLHLVSSSSGLSSTFQRPAGRPRTRSTTISAVCLVPKKLLRCIPLPVPMLLLLLFLSAWLFDKKKKKKALLTTCGVAVGSVVVVVAAAAADTLICLSMGFGGRTAISVAGVFF
jgi:hypothetical protein